MNHSLLRISTALLCLALSVAWLASGTALAQYPEKPVRAIVPFAPGSSNDLMARLTTPLMSRDMGQQVIIINMPGADGRIGIEAMARSAPDGYTILYSGGAISLIPALRKNVPYDPDKDVQPVAELASGPYIVAVTPKLPARNLAELVKYAQDNPGKLNAATAGNSSFMAIVMFAALTGSKVETINYKGTGPAALALMAGEVQLASMEASAFANFIPSGKIRGLVVAGPKRVPGLPDVPTSREAGMPEYMVGTAFGVYTKRGTPMPILRRLNTEVNKAVANPEVSKRLRNAGLEPSATTVEEYTEQYQKDVARWKSVVVKAGLPLQD